MANEELAKYIISIEANLKDLKAGFTESENIVKKSSGQMEGALKSLGNEIKTNFLGSLKQLAFGFVAFTSVTKIIDIFKDARAEYKKSAETQNQLSGAVYGSTVKLKEQAEVLKRKLSIDDDEILRADQRLANYVKDEAQIRKLIPAVIDLAKAKGLDLASAADIVGRAIASDNDQLGRFKIKIDGAADSAERIDSVIAGLNSKFAGQAEQAAKTADGFDRMALAWDDFLKVFGKDISKTGGAADAVAYIIDGATGLYKEIAKANEEAKILANAPRFNKESFTGVGGEQAKKDYLEKVRFDKEIESVMAGIEKRRAADEQKKIDANIDANKKGIEKRKKQEADFTKYNEDRGGTEEEQARANMPEVQKELDDQRKLQTESVAKTEEESNKIRIDFEAENVKIKKDSLDKQTKDTDDALKRQEAAYTEFYNTVMNTSSGITGALSENISIRQENEEEALANSTLSEEEKSAKSIEIQKKYEAERKQIRKAQAMLDFLDAGVSLALAAIKAYAIPIVGPAFAAVIGALGAVQLSIMAANIAQMAEGGLVSGAGSGTSDSIPAMLSNGESVINARSTAMYLPELSRINAAGGGRAFASGGVALSGGSTIVNFIDPLQMERFMASPQGRGALINVISDNRSAVSAALEL